jgi:hypothetical protein
MYRNVEMPAYLIGVSAAVILTVGCQSRQNGEPAEAAPLKPAEVRNETSLAAVQVTGSTLKINRAELSKCVEKGMAFLHEQRITDERPVEGRRFHGLYRSFKADPQNPDSESLAKYGRVWVYDQSLAVYAELKYGHADHAKQAVDALIGLAEYERSKGFRGLLHFSYNTLEDDFVDPRGPLGANLWVLNSILAFMNETGDPIRLGWVNDVLQSYVFPQQVTEPTDPRFGLFRAGLENSADVARGNAMGYHVYEGNTSEINSQVEFCSLEHNADAITTLRLADRLNRRFGTAPALVAEIGRRHRMVMAALDRLWVCETDGQNHFVTGMNSDGTLNRGVAVDNNTWPASVLLPYDEDRAWQCLQYTNRRFRTCDKGFVGLFFFENDFVDKYVNIPPEDRSHMESIIQTEATWGFVYCLKQFAATTDSPQREAEAQALMNEFVASMFAFQEHEHGTPYASRSIRNYFTTLQGIAGTGTAVVVCLELLGKPDDDFIGAHPSRELWDVVSPKR